MKLRTLPILALLLAVLAGCTPASSSVPTGATGTAKMSITATNLVGKLDQLKEAKRSIFPSDGVFMPESEVQFTEGESAFDILERETRARKLHLEFENTPVYNTAYVEGIGNLYELDAGPLSGWMYRVNGEFPNFGSSKYVLKDGDVVEWVYTLDLGKDFDTAVGRQQ
ncbi:MAG: DUF4430 domain-containing protein [Propionibacteriaceae bacterium]|jgi:hypothetical protein|nr:DUF4430 domain-containing protein [Propionibacteriaceae bacterium]